MRQRHYETHFLAWESYQDYNEGLGFIEAGKLYGIDIFLEMFAMDENLTNITPVARLLEVITSRKWKVTIDSNMMLHTFRKRVIDQKSMGKVMKWIERRGNLQKVTDEFSINNMASTTYLLVVHLESFVRLIVTVVVVWVDLMDHDSFSI